MRSSADVSATPDSRAGRRRRCPHDRLPPLAARLARTPRRRRAAAPPRAAQPRLAARGERRPCCWQAAARSPRSTSGSQPGLLSRDTIADVQRELDVEADGIIGPITRAAARRFQRDNGLIADGVIGPQTLAALGIETDAGDRGRLRAASVGDSRARADRGLRVRPRPERRVRRRPLSRQVPVLVGDLADDRRHRRSRAGGRGGAGPARREAAQAGRHEPVAELRLSRPQRRSVLSARDERRTRTDPRRSSERPGAPATAAASAELFGDVDAVVAEAAAIEPGMDVLDVATGTGDDGDPRRSRAAVRRRELRSRAVDVRRHVRPAPRGRGRRARPHMSRRAA